MPNLVSVHGCPHPFRNTRVSDVVVAGATLFEIVERGLDNMKVPAALRGHGHAYIGDRYVPREEWGCTIPEAGEVVTYRIVPQGGGGGGKNPFAAILTIAVIALASIVTFGVGSLLAGGSWAWGFGMAEGLTFGQMALAAGAGLAATAAGMLAVNALVPVKAPSLPSAKSEQDSEVYSISGARNAVAPFGVVPVLLGRHRLVPPQGASPYTEVASNIQYVRQLFILGYSDIELKGDWKVGETKLNTFDGVHYEYLASATSSTTPRYYAKDVMEQPLSVQLKQADGWQNRTTEQECDLVSIDISFPRGLVAFNNSGDKEYRSVQVEAQYRKVGDFTWTDIASGMVVTGKQTTTIRRTYEVEVPSTGFYEVRVRRITADTSDSKISDETWWANLRAVRYTKPIKFNKPLAVMSVRIMATGQLNGALDELNVEAQSVCLDWDRNTQTWVKRATSNPASLFRHVLQHPANARPVPDSQIDLVGLQHWHEFCTDNGFEYNRVHDFQQSVFETLRDVAAAGRAGVSRPDSKWSVVIDEERTTVVQHFTPRNSWGFKSTKALPKMPHGWRVKFVNEDKNYQTDERIVYDDGYSATNATEFEGLELQGVTSPGQVWKLARHHLAVAKLRPEEYEFYADMEHIVCTRGDLIRVTHDVPLWGVASGRVKSVSGLTIVVDEPCQMEAGKRYTIRVRKVDGTTIVREVKSTAGVNTTLSVIGVGMMPEAGDLFMFGELYEESVELVVKTLEPGENFTARILAVDHSPAIFTAASAIVPPFESQITKPYASAVQLPVPVVSNVRSDESILVRNPGGSLTSRICVSFALPSGALASRYTVQAQYQERGAESWLTAPSVPASDGEVFISPVDDGVAYLIRLRSVAPSGLASDWSTTYQHVAVGKTSPPPNVSGINAVAVETGVLLTWDPVNALDLFGYVVRQGSTWDTAGEVYNGKATSVTLPLPMAGDYSYFVKAVDVVGNVSASAAALPFNATDPGAPSVTAGVEGDEIKLSWPTPASMFPIDRYEVRVGDTWATGTSLGTIKATSFSSPGPVAGTYKYWVNAVDAAGNVGGAGVASLTIMAPGAVSVTPQVIDNNVLLNWTAPTTGTLPVKEYELRRGAAWASAKSIGRIAGRFTALFETASGTYTYWVAAIDTAGNFGTPSQTAALVSQPPDYALLSNVDSEFSGSSKNLLVDGTGLVGPADTTETWEQHFTTRGWSALQDQLDAGYPYYLEPTPSSASYQEVFDYGAELAGTKVTVTPTITKIHGSVAVTCKMEKRRLDTDPWVVVGTGYEFFVTAFRYIRVTLTFTPDGGSNDLVKLEKMNVKLYMKSINDAGTAICDAADAGGTTVDFNASFVDVKSITVTPKAGGSAVYALYDFTDAPNPTSFKILLFDVAGTRVSGEASWSAKGV